MAFEREIRDASFVKRWAIVRTIRDQSISDHTFFVAMYTNDICIALNVHPLIHLRALQYALWHDLRDEIFTGDWPGPAKRALAPTAKERAGLTARVEEWAKRVFGSLVNRSGAGEDMEFIKAIVKVADNLDAACEMATELQLGNSNAAPLLDQQTDLVNKSCKVLQQFEDVPPMVYLRLCSDISACIRACHSNHSRGPMVISS